MLLIIQSIWYVKDVSFDLFHPGELHFRVFSHNRSFITRRETKQKHNLTGIQKDGLVNMKGLHRVHEREEELHWEELYTA